MRKTWRLYTGSDGQSHIEAIDVEQQADWLKGLPTTQIAFRVWPDSSEYIERELGHLPAATQRKIVCENAARLYGFSLA